MKLRNWLAAAAAGAILVTNSAAAADLKAPVYGFATLRTVPAEAAKAKAAAYLTSAGKMDAKAFEAVWADAARSTFEKTVDSLVLGNAGAAKVLADAKRADLPAPTEAPAILSDAKADPFFKSNFAAAYAKALSSKRVYEESLVALRAAKPEEVVDPAAFYFYKAVAEHALMHKESAVTSIVRLLDDVADAPDRYKMVATLMFFDIQNWSKDQKDLSNIGRLMDNSGRRLDLARGGQQTQDIQKKIVFRLDEAIKDLENKTKGAQCNGGSCPNGGLPGSGNNIRPSSAAQDSTIMGGGGAGKVDDKRLKKLADEWGKLPAAERAKAVQEITRDLPAKYKPMIEDYFKSLNKITGSEK